MDGWFVVTLRFVPKHRLGCHVGHDLREDVRELGLVVRYDVDVGQVVPGDGGWPVNPPSRWLVGL